MVDGRQDHPATPLGDARSRADGDHLAHHALRHAHLRQVEHGVQIKPGTGAKAIGLQPALGLERGDVPGVEGAIVPRSRLLTIT
jgi:hypothetical protein